MFELLAAGNHTGTGVMAKLSRHQLQQLAIEGPYLQNGSVIEGIGFPTETVLLIAQFTVERALLFEKGATPQRLHEFDLKAQDRINFRFRCFNDKLAKAQTQVTSARSANPMAEATEVTTSKAAGKGAKKAAAKKAPAKAAKKSAKKAAAGSEEGVSRYANDTRKIKILNKENPHREGSGRYNAFEAVKGSKTVADYAATENKPKYLTAWSDSGHIELIG